MVQDLINFLSDSPVSFLAVDTVARRLQSCGFVELDAACPLGEMPSGKRFYVRKNDSSIYAFRIGGKPLSEAGVHMVCAHSDSPTFRIKPNAEMRDASGLTRLNTEVYGGPILSTWFDRPLSVAGRVILRSDNPMRPSTRLLHVRRPLMQISNLAIHFNRAVNDGVKLSRQHDMLPLLGLADGNEAGRMLCDVICSELGCRRDEILDFDLYLYDTTPACTFGVHDEFISAGRLDDLSMVHAGCTALIQACDTMTDATLCLAVFDNEETGSQTKQGAGSPFLASLLRRMVEWQGGGEEGFHTCVERSFMVSADNAHAIHPNHPELSDRDNAPRLNGGIVLKFSAPRRYATDGGSAAAFRALCRRADVPVQTMANRSDLPGGSTLGSIAGTLVPVSAVDIGLAQLAMHAAVEVMGAEDYPRLIAAMRQFYKE